MPNATRRVDAAYNSAKGAFTEIEATHGNATKLLHDVMEAEGTNCLFVCVWHFKQGNIYFVLGL